MTKLRIIPLGGLGEIGKNMTVLEYSRNMIVVDCGLMFPDSEMYGIDLVLPDFDYVLQNQDQLRGIVLTHGQMYLQLGSFQIVYAANIIYKEKHLY